MNVLFNIIYSSAGEVFGLRRGKLVCPASENVHFNSFYSPSMYSIYLNASVFCIIKYDVCCVSVETMRLLYTKYIWGYCTFMNSTNLRYTVWLILYWIKRSFIIFKLNATRRLQILRDSTFVSIKWKKNIIS